MTKLTVIIHSTEDPFIALSRIIEGKSKELLARMTESLKKNGSITFKEAGNPIATIEFIPESWKA